MIKKIIKYSVISLIWIGIWQITAMIVGMELLLPTPWTVLVRLSELVLTLDFYKTVLHSLLRIILGMLAGTLIGVLGGTLTALSSLAKIYLAHNIGSAICENILSSLSNEALLYLPTKLSAVFKWHQIRI